MRRVIVFSNQKGGVGKTTCTREIGIYLSSIGKKVLLIDCDPQANLSKSLLDSSSSGLYEALSGAPHGTEYKLEEVKENLFLLSGNVKLAALEKSLIGEMDAYIRLKNLLSEEPLSARGGSAVGGQGIDFILIDSPPSLGILTINALTASDYCVVPMNPSLYSMHGTNDLMDTLSKVRKNFNSGLQLLGVIINAFDSVPSITKQIRDEIREAFGEKVFSSVLSKSIRIEEAIAEKTGVISLKGARPSKVGEEVKALGDELLGRLGEFTSELRREETEAVK